MNRLKNREFRVQLWKKIHVGLTSEFDFQDFTLHLFGTLASMHAVRVPGGDLVAAISAWWKIW